MNNLLNFWKSCEKQVFVPFLVSLQANTYGDTRKNMDVMTRSREKGEVKYFSTKFYVKRVEIVS
jgi:hypothetical protein